MASNDNIRTRIDPDEKAQGEAVLAELGITTSQALKLFWRQMILQRGLPFDVKVPNAETVDALREPRGTGKRYANARDMMADTLADND